MYYLMQLVFYEKAKFAAIAQWLERIIGNAEVEGSIPSSGTILIKFYSNIFTPTSSLVISENLLKIL